jgi:predicted glycoside hydrolase/deacetylase ChbG (UPF0249 family)
MKKFLIINADDFGHDMDSFNATIELFGKGILTSATIMTGKNATKNAIDFAKQNQKYFSFGLHFNIVDNHDPLYASINNSLINKQGKFKVSNKQRIDALLFRLKKWDIQKELSLQLENLLDYGIRISHIDSHGHLHKFPQILLAIKQTLSSYKINIIRRPQNVFIQKNMIKRFENLIFGRFFKPFKTTDYFFMLDKHNEKEWLKIFLGKLSIGLTELGIHPGYKDMWRNFETQPFLQMNFKKALDDLKIQLLNYDSF